MKWQCGLRTRLTLLFAVKIQSIAFWTPLDITISMKIIHKQSIIRIEESFWAKLRGIAWEIKIQEALDLYYQSVQSLSRVRLFKTPWIAACQASLSITNSQSSLKLMSIEWVMPPSHLILCRPLFLLPPIPCSIRVFSNESALCMRWPKYWSFSFNIIPSKLQMVTAAMKLKDAYSLEGKLWPT